MDYVTQSARFKAIEQPEDARYSCDGCVFDTSPGCMAHACSKGSFPEAHPLSKAERPIIWVAREDA